MHKLDSTNVQLVIATTVRPKVGWGLRPSSVRLSRRASIFMHPMSATIGASDAGTIVCMKNELSTRLATIHCLGRRCRSRVCRRIRHGFGFIYISPPVFPHIISIPILTYTVHSNTYCSHIGCYCRMDRPPDLYM